MSDPSALFVTQAAFPMALVGADGLVVAASRAWERLFEASPPAREVRLQATPACEPGEVLLVATDCSDLGAQAAVLRERVELFEWQALSLSTFAKILAHAPIILSSIDASGVTSMSDGKGLELLGRKPGERVGVNELEAAMGTPAHGHILRALGGETVRAVSEPASGVFLETWYAPLRDENDAIDGVVTLAIDATDRVKSQVQLIENTRVIERQSETIRDLATPIIQVWDEVICLPIIGAVDGGRATVMMEGLLDAIVKEQARHAIVDLTGVDLVDTSTADHLIKLFRAARVLGVESILCGIRPAVAQTMVGLGLDLGSVRTARTLREALKWCIRARSGGRDAPRAQPPRES
jgi:rsbT co-antagonist protein RsbR